MSDVTAPEARSSRPSGIPTARSVDHVAFTVPDLDQAIAWFVDVLGADHVFTAGPFETPPGSDWMTTNVGVHPRTAVRIGMLRLGPATNLELFEYAGPGERRTSWPSNDDVGAAHLCIYVDDLERAIDYLRHQEGVTFLGEPTHIGGDFGADAPNAGITWVYFTTPFGMVVELITYPGGMAYEQATEVRLCSPAAAWDARG